ncbi:hypothetical protein AHiyo4_07860 [Arthrobacter sp. Hiyo4]|nr:hypothetical protein AHiyo4_07860 [Arthrobacter sp. Hiyo4]
MAGRPPLGLDANSTHTFHEPRQLVGYFYEFRIKLLVLDTFEDLVITVQATVETIVGAAPKALAQLSIVLAPLAGGSKESHAGT